MSENRLFRDGLSSYAAKVLCDPLLHERLCIFIIIINGCCKWEACFIWYQFTFRHIKGHKLDGSPFKCSSVKL